MSRDERKDRRGEEEDRIIKLLRGEASEGKNAQWFRNAKDWDVSTRPFVCLFTHLLACSLTPELMRMCRILCPKIRLFRITVTDYYLRFEICFHRMEAEAEAPSKFTASKTLTTTEFLNIT